MNISIITVSYNSEKTIKDTIYSVLNQTVLPYEYIVKDGGSTDDTLNILESFKKDFNSKGIKYTIISTKDKGLYFAMNEAIEISNGDYIGIINSDDWYELNAISIIKDAIIKNDSPDVIYGLNRIVNNNGYTYLRYNSALSHIKYYMCINHPSVFVRKKIYDLHGCFDTRYRSSADYDMILRLYNENCIFKECNCTISNMRLGGFSELNYKLGLKEKVEIQKHHGTCRPAIYSLYFYYTIKHTIINFMLSHQINYHRFIKKQIR